MLVFDYRYNAVRKKTAEYNTVAPEMYATVIEDESIQTVDDIKFVTTFTINKHEDGVDKALNCMGVDAPKLVPFIDFAYSQMDLKTSNLSFDEMVTEFMKTRNITDYRPHKTTIHLSKKLIKEYMDDEEE